MTLILTELSDAGIAMLTDSAICRVNPRTGLIVSSDEQWQKLITVPKLNAAVAYWGMIGLIEPSRRFDEWLHDWINSADCHDLPSFARELASHLNRSCHGRILDEGQTAGIHVAGISRWDDGVDRPMLFHIHNGHSAIEMKVTTIASTTVMTAGTSSFSFPSGAANFSQINVLLDAARQPGARFEYVVRNESRRVFEAHNDFPNPKWTHEENLDRLRQGHLTTNGDYAPFALIAGAVDSVRVTLNSMPGTSIPRDPGKVGARMGYLHMLMNTIIRFYHCSTMPRTIGGTLRSLGITATGLYYNEADFETSNWNWLPNQGSTNPHRP